MNSKKRRLEYGLDIPLMGLGVSRIPYCQEPKDIPLDLGSSFIRPSDVIYYSIKNGVRLIDISNESYEREMGKGIIKALDDNICKREELIIIGKIWVNLRKDPEKALRKTLDHLNLSYIDIYVDHYPTGKDYRDNAYNKFEMISIYEFWPKMEKLVEKGLTKSLGVSNYNIQCLCNLLSFCLIKPVINEIEFHLFYMQEDLKKFCDKLNIAVIAYYPMVHGNGARIYLKNNPEFDIFKDELILKLSKEYDKTPGQIILNWHYCVGVIPIPGTSKIDRMKENLKALDFKMKDEDIQKLSNHFKKMPLKKFCGNRRFFGINILG